MKKEIDDLKIKVENESRGKKNLEELFGVQQRLTEINEFSYLALFFVDQTKRVLKWFYDSKSNQTITKESFNQLWLPFITDLNQREVIFTLLNAYGMISGVLGGAFVITEKGERFLKSINFI